MELTQHDLQIMNWMLSLMIVGIGVVVLSWPDKR